MLNENLLKCKLNTGTLVVSSFYDEVYMYPFLATYYDVGELWYLINKSIDQEVAIVHPLFLTVI